MQPTTPFPIWPGTPPGSENATQKELVYRNPGGQLMIRNVVLPTITPYLPKPGTATGTGVIVAPGGGFRFHSWESEGTAVAEWLRDKGIAAFLLKYRLMDTGPTDETFQKALAVLFGNINKLTQDKTGATRLGADPDEAAAIGWAVADGQQALRIVRQRASTWQLRPDRIGMLGFSAGAEVTLRATLHPDPAVRPSFAAPIYGPATGAITVPKPTPPLFLLCAADDAIAASGATALFTAWRAAGGSAELHLYSKGGHGFGMNHQNLPTDRWIERFHDWLHAQQLV